ncbi:MAG: hypothetical protein NZ653_06310 [Anaerolineae bacterium]|nr:hypothetical protein [Anaerolineae bacterium]
MREILFGTQIRSTERRLEGLEARIETNYRELTEMVNQKTSSLADSFANQLASVRRELIEGVERLASEQTAQLRATQRTISDRLEKQWNDHSKDNQTRRRASCPVACPPERVKEAN